MDMDMFQQLDLLKKRIQDEVLLNQNLLKLIVYEDNKPLENPDIEDVQSIVDKNIYFKPIAYNNVTQDARTILVTSFRLVPTYKTNSFVNAEFYLRIIMHNELIDIEINNEIKSRMFCICSEINKSFLKATGEWLGECDFVECGEMTTEQNHYGVMLKYRVSNFKQ